MSQAAACVDASDQSIHVEFSDWFEPIHTVRVGGPLLQVHPSTGSWAHGKLTLITRPCVQHHVLRVCVLIYWRSIVVFFQYRYPLTELTPPQTSAFGTAIEQTPAP